MNASESRFSGYLQNPATGDRMKVVHSGSDTLGGSAKLRFVLAPYSRGMPMHFHSFMVKTIRVESGRLVVCRGEEAEQRLLCAGELVKIPAGLLHSYRNASENPVAFTIDVRPAGRFEHFHRIVYGMAAYGLVDRAGLPKNPLLMAKLMKMSDTYLSGLSMIVQQSLMEALLWLGRRLGRDHDLQPYLDYSLKEPEEAALAS